MLCSPRSWEPADPDPAPKAEQLTSPQMRSSHAVRPGRPDDNAVPEIPSGALRRVDTPPGPPGATADPGGPWTGVADATQPRLKATPAAPFTVPRQTPAASRSPDTPAQIRRRARALGLASVVPRPCASPATTSRFEGRASSKSWAPCGPVGTTDAMSYTVEIDRFLPFSERRFRDVVSERAAGGHQRTPWADGIP